MSQPRETVGFYVDDKGVTTVFMPDMQPASDGELQDLSSLQAVDDQTRERSDSVTPTIILDSPAPDPDAMKPYWDFVPELHPPAGLCVFPDTDTAIQAIQAVFPSIKGEHILVIVTALTGNLGSTNLILFEQALIQIRSWGVEVDADALLDNEEDDDIHRIPSTRAGGLPAIEEVLLDEEEPVQGYESALTAGSQPDESASAQLAAPAASIQEAPEEGVRSQAVEAILSPEKKEWLREQAANFLAARADQEEIEDSPSPDLPLMPGRAALAVRLARWFNRNSKMNEPRTIPRWLIAGIAVLILLIMGLSLAYLFKSDAELRVKVDADSERLNQTIELVNEIDKWRTNKFLAQEREKNELTAERDEYRELAADFDAAMRDYEKANRIEQERLQKRMATLNWQIKKAQQRIRALEAANPSQANLAPRE